MLEDRWIDIGGVRTRYVKAGSSGPTIVLLHASGLSDQGICHNLRIWEANIADMARRARVVAFDALGQGRTDAPPDAPFGFDRVIGHARAFIGAIASGPVHLVGHDEGGLAALRLAFEEPAMVSSVTIVAGKAVAPAGDPVSNLTLSAPLEPRYSGIGQTWVMERICHRVDHIDAGRFLAEAMEIAGEPAFRSLHGDSTFDAVMRPSLSRMRVDNWTRLREQGVPRPVMLVWGEQDPLSPVQNAMALFRLIAERQRDTQLRIIGRAGYMPFREQSAAFNGIVSGFVSALEAASARPGPPTTE
ncbi:alpha/beta fold hydrolase [Mesorhizobium sp. L-8-10]|uniref:alpha/beta fold hydrolase n=1 Tax=Mesorhizobium sp. L-8-10 TaxID=2744523 RepID=UPI001925F2E7|nr:alpha/beta hydrolase [Mesorhizobium sp. L-8-10]